MWTVWPVVWALFLLYWLVAIVGSIGFFGLWRRSETAKQSSAADINKLTVAVPGVTILRPLKGIDPFLYECLESTFKAPFPHETLLCVADRDDPAVAVAEKLLAAYPNADAKILVGYESYGPNPKINNLAKGYAQAKYDVIWTLDCNVWVSPESLVQAVRGLAENPLIQLVHNLPIAVAMDDCHGSLVDQMYLLTSHAKFYTGINDVGVAPCVCGKSNLYRRSFLDNATNSQAGEGIQTFAKYISEDQMIAEAIWGAGGRTHMVDSPVIQPLESRSLSWYLDRRIRWIRVRKYNVIAATLVEPATECLLSGMIGAYACGSIVFGGFSLVWLMSHVVIWCSLDFIQFNRILEFKNIQGQPPFVNSTTMQLWSRPRWLATWAARELLCLPVWGAAMVGTRIEWRGRPFRIRSDLVAEEIRD